MRDAARQRWTANVHGHGGHGGRLGKHRGRRSAGQAHVQRFAAGVVMIYV